MPLVVLTALCVIAFALFLSLAVFFRLARASKRSAGPESKEESGDGARPGSRTVDAAPQLLRSSTPNDSNAKLFPPNARQPGEFTSFFEPNKPKESDRPPARSEGISQAKENLPDHLVGATPPPRSARHKLDRVAQTGDFTSLFGSPEQPAEGEGRPATAPDCGLPTELQGQQTLSSWTLLTSFKSGTLQKARRRRVDAVHFAVTSNAAVAAGSATVINVWAYLGSQYEDTLARARRATPGAEPRIQSQGPVELMRGTRVSLRMKISGISLVSNDGTILWAGDISNVTFAAHVPADTTLGPHAGSLCIFANGLQIARLHFLVIVGVGASDDLRVAEIEEPFHKAFASYASADRNEVLARVQGIQKIAPDLDIFLDVLTLRSGEQWAPRLQEEIASSDVFYLFWSENAKGSAWVEKEWRYALESKGLQFIDPVPLVSPELVPPPPELAAKHFNDWTLAYNRSAR